MNKKEIKNKKSWKAPQLTNLDGSDTEAGNAVGAEGAFLGTSMPTPFNTMRFVGSVS